MNNLTQRCITNWFGPRLPESRGGRVSSIGSTSDDALRDHGNGHPRSRLPSGDYPNARIRARRSQAPDSIPRPTPGENNERPTPDTENTNDNTTMIDIENEPITYCNDAGHQRTIIDYFNPTDLPTGKKNLRANIGIGTLNIRGGGSTATDGKWGHMNQMMKDHKLGILAVQETHLTTRTVKALNEKHKRLHIINSALGQRANAAGIAIVLNKDYTAWREEEHWVLIPGRAILVRIPWKNSGGNKRTFLAIYAPNRAKENKEMWQRLEHKFRNSNLPRPDFMLGDFNMVEEALDRLPARTDQATVVESLRDLKSYLKLVDGWRKENGEGKAYSYLQANSSVQSRIDRIYTREELYINTCDWEIHAGQGIVSDHDLVTVKYFDPGIPQIGKGRWALPVWLTDDADFITVWMKDTMNETLDKITAHTEERRTKDRNPQKVLYDFKKEAASNGENFMLRKTPQFKAKVYKRENDLRALLNRVDINEEDKMESAAYIEEELRQMQAQHHLSTRERIHLKYSLEGEIIGKTWINANKDRRPRDLITALKKLRPDGRGDLEYDSRKISKIARDYHNDLQQKGRCHEVPTEERKAAFDKAIDSLDQKLSERDNQSLTLKITAKEIREAIFDGQNDKAPGLDGLPIELWKALTKRPSEISEDEDEETVRDAALLLKVAFNDIIEYGVEEGTEFNAGWMSPIHKKKNKADIANYRPITILNTDYKTLTKVLTKRITGPATTLIHEDQAGFMKGRRIENQTDLIKTMIDYGESEDVRGMLVFLDQEKAYDKIMHDFLYATLEKMNFPPNFIRAVKALYGNARTCVIINGMISDPFDIIRGVRQGDPLSCLLFNFAIESLACMIRKSNLKGFTTPRMKERLILSMFADDTTVFLSEEDDFHCLQEILDTWCLASGAKFNVDKTEIVPIGKKPYRDELRRTRGETPERRPIPASINIAREKEPVRALGAFVGNNIVDISVWTPTLEDIDAALTRWARSSPTMEGRRLIVNMEVGGRTQYRTMVQGMPPEILKRLKKTIRDFIWDDKASYVNIDTMHLPFEMGGMKILDLEARNEAIRLMRLKRYLDFERRPRWALIADYLLSRNVPKMYGDINPDDLVNMFTQTWKAAKQTNRSVAPQPIREMIKTASKYGARLWTNHPSESLKRAMPIWFHVASKRSQAASNASNHWTRCQRDVHKIETMGQMFDYSNEEETHTLTTDENDPEYPDDCICERCNADRAKGCLHPSKCREKASEFLRTINKTWIPTPERDENDEESREASGKFVPYNRAKNFTEAIRIFTSGDAPSTAIDIDLNTLFGVDSDLTQVEEEIYTDGSCKKGDDNKMKAGSGIWFGDNDDRNIALRIPDTLSQTNNVAEASAILVALQETEDHIPIKICTDSQVTLTMIGKSLLQAEDTAWMNTKNREILEPLVATLRRRKAATVLEKVRAHVGIHGNEEADRLTNEGADKETAERDIDTRVPGNQRVEGIRLEGATQSLIYKSIRAIKSKSVKERRATTMHLDLVRHEIEERTGRILTDEEIWMSYRGKAIRNKRTRQLLWKLTHQGLPIGTYWDKITNFETRGRCTGCDTIESAEHIFTECRYTGQDAVWNIVRRILEKKGIEWRRPTLGTVLGCGVSNIKNERTGGPRPEADRLYTTLITEATQFIWRKRCSWKIDKDGDPERAPTKKEIHNQFVSTINKVIRFDILTTSYVPKKNKNRKRLNIPTEELVINTWWDIVDSNDELEWETLRKRRRRKTGVLVGIAMMRD
ncbi:hypothetical protein D9611_008631 [Ephemerocybe angulata]|uniref:Reverse transcriptase n=1 Tax=Ephemerocybe angulata TaxID=980116 RepID=A0A8H5AZ14_9AGAR|nr:hypothetical protein D9611_008631 [Tulosesus angulatus]